MHTKRIFAAFRRRTTYEEGADRAPEWRLYMRLLFVRHGDPDYEHDRLNEIGLREARALAALIPRMNVGTCFASPLGRAQETAAIALGKAVPGARGAEAAAACGDVFTTLDWLREFPAQVDVNDTPLLQEAYYLKTLPDGTYKKRIVWDMYPSYYVEHPAYSDFDDWRTTLVAHNSDLLPIYDRVIASFDALLAERGYVREGRHYRVEKESRETLTFFCHFGITCVLLSHMWNVSPFVTAISLHAHFLGDRVLFRRKTAGLRAFPCDQDRRHHASDHGGSQDRETPSLGAVHRYLQRLYTEARLKLDAHLSGGIILSDDNVLTAKRIHKR